MSLGSNGIGRTAEAPRRQGGRTRPSAVTNQVVMTGTCCGLDGSEKVPKEGFCSYGNIAEYGFDSVGKKPTERPQLRMLCRAYDTSNSRHILYHNYNRV